MDAVIRDRGEYEFSRFEDRENLKKPLAKRSSKTKTITLFGVFSYMLGIFLAFLMIFSYVRLTETSDTTAKLKKELNTLREEVQSLNIERNKLYGKERIKSEAEARFGMRKIEKSQITYVNTSGDDRVEINESEGPLYDNSKLVAGIARGFDAIVEYIN